MRRRRLRKLVKRLRELQRQDLTRDELLLKLGAAKKEAGQGLWPADDPHAEEGSAGHAANLPFHAGSQEAARRAPARGRLSAALQHQRRRSRRALAALSAIGRDRAGVQGIEERSFGPADLSPARDPHRSPHLRGVPGLLPEVTLETAA